MTKTLIIVEAPSKASHISQFLGSDYIVKASVGHVTEMPVPKSMSEDEKKKYGQYAQDVQSNFEPLYHVSPDKKKVVAELKRLLKTVDELVLGTDADNEGAAIAWHLFQQLKPTIPTYRATWNEITEKAVRAGLQQRQLVDFKKQEPADFFGQAESALTRAQWDRLYGYGSSPYVWKTIKPGTSSGRVQTPGTRLIVEREERRLAFTSVSFYSIWGTFDGVKARLVEFDGKKVADGSKIDEEGKLTKGYTLITDENLDSTMTALQAKNYAVGDVTSKPYRRSPPPPFTTSSGLQSIGGKTRQSAKQITRYLQDLYASDGAVTYIRTVSVVAAPEAITEARSEIKRLFGAALLPSTPRIYKDKGSGNSGHECIRAVLDDKTGKLVNPRFSDPKKQEVFDLIRLRFLASQAIDCEGTTWTAVIDASDKTAKFSASETEIHEPGWTTIYQVDEEVGA
jgi:DNA topoisomerase-1